MLPLMTSFNILLIFHERTEGKQNPAALLRSRAFESKKDVSKREEAEFAVVVSVSGFH